MGAGKGDAPRPLSVPATTFADRWAQTFPKRVSAPLPEEPNPQEPHASQGEPNGA